MDFDSRPRCNKNKVVTILCFNRRSEVLIHLRDSQAPIYPLHFAFVSGQMRIGELPARAGYRELNEELGKRTNIKYLGVIKLSKEARSIHVFRANVNDHRLRCFEGIGVDWVRPTSLRQKKFYGYGVKHTQSRSHILYGLSSIEKLSRMLTDHTSQVLPSSKGPCLCSGQSKRFCHQRRMAHRYKWLRHC